MAGRNQQIGKKVGGAMKDMISDIAQALADHPEKISVTEIEGNLVWVPGLKYTK